jgi:NitT/TauT family transport system permease protein
VDRANPLKVRTPQQRWSLQVVRWGIVALFLILWEAGARTGTLDVFYFSMPSKIIRNVWIWLKNGILINNLAVTLAEAATGLVIGVILGMVVGFLLASRPKINFILQPFISIMNAMPRIAFAPLLILWFGLGFVSKVVVVISLVFFIVFFNTYRGFNEVSPVLLKNARVLGATRQQILWHVYLPATMSWIFASIRVSVGFAIIAAIVGEYIGATAGIGYLIDNAQSNFDATGVMTGLAILTCIVAVLDPVLRRIEKHFLKWQMGNQSLGGIV